MTNEEIKELHECPERWMLKPFFDLVCDKDNWKRNIDREIPAPYPGQDHDLFIRMLKRAIEFYAGGEAAIVYSRERYVNGRVVGCYVRVTAPGYYALIGA